ncbi:MAG TPA: winged helix-turn-helix domain-containing protein [Candidatus Acidoferrum sp.]|nr:winged helix-turn-helix domain-containing protein [Candidatus Acidoferrum sp.]
MAKMPGDAANRVIRFGIFDVDFRAGQLRRNGVRVRLQEQPFQVLAMLLERPGEVVTREDLHARLWPADTFVDFDHGLNAAVKRLRDALGDSADNPRFVETLARRGYRFLAPVEFPSEEAPAVQTSPPRNAGVSDATKSRWRLVAAAFAVVLFALGIGLHLGMRASRALQPVLPKEIRLTANSPDAPVYFGAISPDGRYLAYIDPRGAFLREIATDESHPLPLSEGFRVHHLSWYPDGSHLLAEAVAGSEERSGLWNVPLLGGTPRKLVTEAEAGSVSPDGKQIAFLRGDKFDHPEIWLTSTDGGEPRLAVNVPGFVIGPPAWSPDSQRFAYLKDVYWPGYSAEDVQIEMYELASGKTDLILNDYRLQYGLVWTRDNRLLFSRAEEPPGQGESNVWSLKVDTRPGWRWGAPVRLTSGPDWKPVINMSADGLHAVFIRSNIAPAVFVADVGARTREIGRLQRLTLDERQSRPYEWTPDGKSVLYVSDREGTFHIFRQQIGAATPELIAGVQGSPIILRLNPERTEILYLAEAERKTADAGNGAASSQNSNGAGHSAANTQPEGEFQSRNLRLMRVPLDGGVSQLVLEDSGINNFQCARWPSHECLYSRYTKGALVFEEFDAKTGAKKELFRTSEPEWQYFNWTLSPDGRTLALAKKMRASTEAEIRLAPTRGGTERVIKVKDWGRLATIDWAADGKSFWASAVRHGETTALINIDLQGRARPVLQESKPYVGWAIPSQDGKHLAIWEATGGSNAWMLEVPPAW